MGRTSLAFLSDGASSSRGCRARGKSTSEESEDDVVESRDDEQGRDKHGESTNKAPSVDLPASDFVCVSHFLHLMFSGFVGAERTPYVE